MGLGSFFHSPTDQVEIVFSDRKTGRFTTHLPDLGSHHQRVIFENITRLEVRANGNQLRTGRQNRNARLARHGVAWLRELASGGTLVLTADPGRTYSLSAGLQPLAEYATRSVPEVEHPNLQTVRVFRLLSEG